MTVYVETSALMKRYVEEPESEACDALLAANPTWVSARHTEVEIRRNLARLLPSGVLADAQQRFRDDWARTHVVELDKEVCQTAGDLAEATGARSLDAVHLGAAQQAGGGSLPIVTYDLRLAQAARSLGWTVLNP